MTGDSTFGHTAYVPPYGAQKQSYGEHYRHSWTMKKYNNTCCIYYVEEKMVFRIQYALYCIKSCSITNTDTKLRMQWAQLYVFYFSTFKVTTGLLLEELEVGCLTTSSISIRFWAKKSATFLFTETWITLACLFTVFPSQLVWIAMPLEYIQSNMSGRAGYQVQYCIH